MKLQLPWKSRQTFAIYWGAVIVAVIVLPLILHAALPRNPVREERIAAIEEMSETERTRLRLNLEAFQRLSAAEQQQLRAMHRELERDAASGGDLNEVLDNYVAWLETLTPGQRDDLRRQADPIKRIEMIEEIRNEQAARRSIDPDRRWPGFAGFGGRDDGVPPLTGSDLDTVMDIFASRLDLSADERKQLDAMGRAERFASILRRFGERTPDRFGGTLRWLDESVLKEVQASVENSRLRTAMEEVAPLQAREILRRVVFIGLMIETGRELDAINQTAQRELKDFFDELSGEQRDEIMQMPYDAGRRRLVELYAEANPESEAGDWLKARRAAWQLWERDRPRPGRGPDRDADRTRGDRADDRPPLRPGPGGAGLERFPRNGDRPGLLPGRRGT